MDDVFVRIIDMPDNVKGFVLPGADGYNVYINNRLDRADQIKAYEHELRHIQRNDFSGGDIHEIEHHAHNGR